MIRTTSEQEVFVQGFKLGYSKGRDAGSAYSDIDSDAKSAFQTWSQQQHAGFGKVIPTEGLNQEEKK